MQLASSTISPDRYYSVTDEGTLAPTGAYWILLSAGSAGLIAVMLRLVTGSMAALTLMGVITLGLVLFNAGSVLSGKCQKKVLKTLSYYR